MKRTKQDINYSEQNLKLARFAKALAHPVRLEILNFLEHQNCCFTGDLVDILPLAQSTVSQHLKELKDAGLIQGTVNPPKVKYCINQEAWQEAKTLFEALFQSQNKTQIQWSLKF